MSREMKRLAMKVSRELVTQRVDLGDDSYDVISDAVERLGNFLASYTQ